MLVAAFEQLASASSFPQKWANSDRDPAPDSASIQALTKRMQCCVVSDPGVIDLAPLPVDSTEEGSMISDEDEEPLGQRSYVHAKTMMGDGRMVMRLLKSSDEMARKMMFHDMVRSRLMRGGQQDFLVQMKRLELIAVVGDPLNMNCTVQFSHCEFAVSIVAFYIVKDKSSHWCATFSIVSPNPGAIVT